MSLFVLRFVAELTQMAPLRRVRCWFVVVCRFLAPACVCDFRCFHTLQATRAMHVACATKTNFAFAPSRSTQNDLSSSLLCVRALPATSILPMRWQILKYGSANILFLAMTVCVPLVSRTLAFDIFVQFGGGDSLDDDQPTIWLRVGRRAAWFL